MSLEKSRLLGTSYKGGQLLSGDPQPGFTRGDGQSSTTSVVEEVFLQAW